MGYQPFDGYREAQRSIITNDVPRFPDWKWLAKRRLKFHVAVGHIESFEAHRLLKEWTDVRQQFRDRKKAAKELWKKKGETK